MVVAQLVELSLLTKEVCSLNPVIRNNYNEHLFTVNSIEKTKTNKKMQGMARLKNKTYFLVPTELIAPNVVPITNRPKDNKSRLDSFSTRISVLSHPVSKIR